MGIPIGELEHCSHLTLSTVYKLSPCVVIQADPSPNVVNDGTCFQRAANASNEHCHPHLLDTRLQLSSLDGKWWEKAGGLLTTLVQQQQHGSEWDQVLHALCPWEIYQQF